jgi:uncharacterized protein (TIGR02117 family)
MRKALWRAIRYAAGFAGMIVLLVGGYLGATVIGSQIAADRPLIDGSGEPAKIYLVTSLLHADFAIPVDDPLRQRFAFLRDAEIPLDHPELRYLIFGWGSRAFYLNTPTLADLRPGPTIRAITGDASVMHVMAGRDVSKLPSAVAITLPPGGLERLLAFIEAGFTRKDGKVLFLPGSGYGTADAFFEGEGGFDIFRPCNIWVANGLREAGISTGAWTPTTWSLLRGLRLHSPAALDHSSASRQS